MLYRAHLLTPVASARLLDLPDGGLRVDPAGRITHVGPFQALEAALPEEQVTDLRPFWILPGLVDLHSHLPQYEAVAMDGLPLLPWLEKFIFPAESRFQDPQLAALAARKYFQDQLAWGTTTTVAYCTVHQEAAHRAFQEAEACGIRGLLGKVMMDQNSPATLREDTADSLARSEELCRSWHGRDGGRLQYVFTPRFAPTCTRELLEGVGRLAQAHQAYIQTHLSENLQELAWVKELFPEARDYTDVYGRSGMLGPRTLLGHGIHLSPAEREALREAGAVIVHCPRSNAFLSSGIMPLRRWLEEGMAVGLGTDVGAGPSLDLWSEMAAACSASKLLWATQQNLGDRLSRVDTLDAAQRQELTKAMDLTPEPPIDPVAAFRLATLDGARALGLEKVTGSLEAGKEADFLVVDPRVVDPAASRPEEDPAMVLSRLMFRPDRAMVRATYVRGRRCHALEP